MITSSSGAALAGPSVRSRGSLSAAVLVFHGGSADSFDVAGWRDPAVLRLRPVARAIRRDVPGVAVYRLRFSVRGWNGGESALRDARWALQVIREQHPDLPIVLVGHSLGGRVALRVGGDPDVAGVVGLTPWVPSDEPAAQLAGVPVVIIQGGRDRVIPEPTTRPWLARAHHAGARVTRTILPWAGHTMLRRFWVWHRLAADGVRTVLAESGVISRPDVVSPIVPTPQPPSP